MSIEVRNVSKSFGGYQALRDVNLKVNDGELVALLGPSGSGKTTLLRIIAGLETADEAAGAAVLFDGEDRTQSGSTERGVGFVFQHYALFRHMTVFENVAFGLRVRPKAARPSDEAIKSKVRELLQLIQLENLGGRFPAQLSGGQRQRVALARALAVEPRVLLLDEPFGALDAKVRTELRRWLRRLHNTIPITSILVTHDQDEALEVADRIVVMNQSRIEQVGTPHEVFHEPATPFVMDFLGHVNLFHGRVEEGQTKLGGGTEKVFARPFQLDIHRHEVVHGAVRARVERVQSAGSNVRVELVGENGEPILVELSHERFREAPVQAKDEVFVSLRDARVFHEDYSI